MQTTVHTGAGRKEAKGPSQPHSAHWGAGRACNGAINPQQGPESMTYGPGFPRENTCIKSHLLDD